MKIFKLFSVALVLATSLLICSCESEGGLSSIRSRLDELENVVIPSINQQIDSINNSITTLSKTSKLLSEYVSALQEEVKGLEGGVTPETAGLQKQIDSLSSVCKTFSSDLEKLQKYVDDKDAATRSWAEATFATIEQYNTVQSDLSNIKTKLESLDADKIKSDVLDAMNDEIDAAIKKSEESIKSWVGEKLSGYYTIAEIDAKLKDIESGSSSLSDDDKAIIENLRNEVKTAKEDLTKAYQQAISDAIEKNNGVIDEKISAAIETATATLNKTIEGINEKIADLEKRIEDLEKQMKSLLNRVQSITLVPEYSDGSVDISKTKGATLNFEIYPLEVAESLAKAGKDVLSLKAVYTKTKAEAGEFVDLDISACAYADGIFSVTASGEKLGNDFFDGTIKASARLGISSGDISVASQYFPINPAE